MLGILAQTVWFFLWLGLLQHWDLSLIFPFEGLNPLLLVFAAWLILREKLSIANWVGVALITGGVAGWWLLKIYWKQFRAWPNRRGPSHIEAGGRRLRVRQIAGGGRHESMNHSYER